MVQSIQSMALLSPIHHFFLFMATSIVLILVPGPDSIYVVSRSIAQGRQAGLLSSLGTCTGAFVHIIAASLGLSAILATSAYTFTVVKAIGALYLIYLGVKTFFAQPQWEVDLEQKTDSGWAIFGQGILVDVLNPKTALFFLAFLPQFVPASHAHVSSFIFLGISFILMALVWDFILILGSTSLTGYLRQNVSFGKRLNQATGLIFVGLGVKLAAEKL